MGMFDIYIPRPQILCPRCSQALSDWQGKNGPCALLVFEQGAFGATRQEIPDECKCLSAEQLRAFRLGEHFLIYTSCCGYWYEAECTSHEGRWNESKLTGSRGCIHTTSRRQKKHDRWAPLLKRPHETNE